MDNVAQKKTITSADAGTKVLIMGAKGIFHSVTINATSAQALTLYDDKTITSPSGSFAVLKASVVEGSYQYGMNGVACDKGLVVDVPGSYSGNATFAFKLA